MGINLADCDVEMLDESDFVETDDDSSLLTCPLNLLHAAFFVQYVKLCKIIGQIFSTYYSATSKVDKQASQTHLEYDKRLTTWRQQRLPEMVWQKWAHEFWTSILGLHYR